MAAKVLSIEIGDSRTKVVEMDDKASSAKVYQYFSFETPGGIVNDGVVKSEESFCRILKGELQKRNIHTRKVVFAIDSARIANREVTIPMVKENKIHALLAANSSEYFPVDLKEYQLVYRIIDKVETPDDKKYKLLVFAVPIEIVSSYQKLAAFCSLSLRTLDYVGNSIYQEMKLMSDQEQLVILKVDENSSMITIVQDGKAKLQRSIPYGIGVRENNTGEISSEEKEDLRYLIGNVSRVIDYYTTQNRENPITEIRLAGIGAKLDGFAEMLNQELNIKVEELRVLPNISVGRSAEEAFCASEYIACAGALLNPLPFRLSGEKKGKNRNQAAGDSFRLPVLVAGGCAVISLVLILTGMFQYMSLKSEGERLESRIAELQPAQQVYNTYNQTMQQYQDVQNMEGMTATPNDAFLVFLGELEKNMPSDMKITGMSANAQGVIMSITTADKESAAKVIMELRECTTLDSVTATEISEEQDETGVKKVSFTVNCTYSAKGGTEDENK